jgi:hypothetical protein
MAQQLPLPLAIEDWKTWASRLVKVLNDTFSPLTASETGRLSEFVIVPTGWLPTNGGTIVNVSFPALAQVLGTTFGAAPAGQTRLPNITSTHTGFTVAVKA